MPIEPGDILMTGAGPRAARGRLNDAIDDACQRHGEDTVAGAIAVQSRVVLAFCDWYRRREHAAAEDTRMGYMPSPGGGVDPDGVPLSADQRIVPEVEMLLQRIMADPRGTLKGLDTPDAPGV